MKKETIWILPPRKEGTREYEQRIVTPLKCNGIDGIVYLRNKEPLDADETYIAYDYKSGLAIVMAGKVKDLIVKVESLKDKIKERRNLDWYKKVIKNSIDF